MKPRTVVIQLNPTSGSGRNRAEVLNLVARLKQHGLRPRLFTSRERLTRLIDRPERRSDVACIVAAGGDGTVSDVVNRCGELPVAILPLGTENLIARYLKVPRAGKEAADLIAAGRRRRLDACRLNNRRFLIMASVGFDAEVVRRTHARRKGHITKLTYVRPICEALRRYRYPRLSIHADDAPPLAARLAVVVNLPVYALGLRVADCARGDDGFADVRLFERGSAFQMVRYFYKVMRGRHERLADVRSVRACRVRIEAEEPAPVQMDGDPAGLTPATIEVQPAAWEVLAPDPA